MILVRATSVQKSNPYSVSRRDGYPSQALRVPLIIDLAGIWRGASSWPRPSRPTTLGPVRCSPTSTSTSTSASPAEKLYDGVVGCFGPVVAVEQERVVRRSPGVLEHRSVVAQFTGNFQEAHTASLTPQAVIPTHLETCRHALVTAT